MFAGRMDAFILLVHQMVFGLVLVYVGYVRDSEGATQMREHAAPLDCQNGDVLPLGCPLWCCWGIHVAPFTVACYCFLCDPFSGGKPHLYMDLLSFGIHVAFGCVLACRKGFRERAKCFCGYCVA